MCDKKAVLKWYHRPFIVLIAVLAAGPFALPLVWASPSFTKAAKIAITVILIALTIWLVKASADLYNILMKQLQDLQNVYSH